MDRLGLAGLRHCRYRHPASDGGGADLRPTLSAVRPCRHRWRRWPGRAWVNPEKSLVATISSGHRGGPDQSFRYV